MVGASPGFGRDLGKATQAARESQDAGTTGGRSNESQRGGQGVTRRARRLENGGNGTDSPLMNGTQAPAPIDPAPKTADQIASETAARQAETRRAGRGSTILTGRLGEAAGPNISRRTLGGL